MLTRTRFNPTRVRLKLSNVSQMDSYRRRLQPHEGSSETRRFYAVMPMCPSFNPTRVRLKHEGIVSVGFNAARLQPHEGSSETRAVGRPCRVRVSFNPTRVRLKPSRSPLSLSGRRFNPTRVRLKHVIVDGDDDMIIKLQPHEGSSETAISREGAAETQQLQPHEGSSETRETCPASGPVVVLQPHEGSSETQERGLTVPGWSVLQPHEGSSETTDSVSGDNDESGFNPTRVRLKPTVTVDAAASTVASTPRGFV